MKPKKGRSLSPLHYLHISSEGTFERDTASGKGDRKVKSSPRHVDNLFEHLDKNSIPRLAVFIHGGLVNERAGMDAAERFRCFYNNKQIHTYGFVWETGFLTELFKLLEDKTQQSEIRAYLMRLGKLMAKKFGLGVQSALEDPEEWAKMLNQPENIHAVEEQSLAYSTQALEAIEGSLIEELGDEGDARYPEHDAVKKRLGPLSVMAHCIYRISRKRNHGILATVQEEIMRELGLSGLAMGIWGEMKTQAETMWKSNEGREEDAQYAGRYFLEALNGYMGKHKGFKVELVAHSAGAIVVCRLLELLQKEKEQFNEVRFNNITFLAPACHCRLFADTLMKETSYFKAYRQFSMLRNAEESDILVLDFRWLYAMSLLYFVSGLCESGLKDEDVVGDACILGLEQHVAGKYPYDAYDLLNDINNYLNNEAKNGKRIALVPSKVQTSKPGYRGNVRDHIDFDNDSPNQDENSIRSSIQYIWSQS